MTYQTLLKIPSAGRLLALLVLLAGAPLLSRGQGGSLILSMAPIDGVELSPDNAFGYSIRSTLGAAKEALIKGKLTCRATGQYFTYSYHYVIRPGLNTIDRSAVRAEWSFSSGALRELFVDYKRLPAGSYEYCVEVTPVGPGGEVVAGGDDHDCIGGRVDDLFLINLVSPENGAKLHENYPVLSWMVNYAFASALSYKVRVAEVKEGQNNTAAVSRNNPVYEEGGIMATTQTYPVYGKELAKFVPYAWTVDAYYKGLLLGGAEPWRFTIIDDSLMKGVPTESFFVDIRRENDITAYYAVGVVKLKYTLDEQMEEPLTIKLLDKNGKEVKLGVRELSAKLGENRFEINLKDQSPLSHLGSYTLVVSNTRNQEYRLPFKYVNPDFVH